MDLVLWKILEESEELAEHLRSLLQQDRDEIRRCMRGDVLTEYQKAADKAIESAGEIIRQISYLRS